MVLERDVDGIPTERFYERDLRSDDEFFVRIDGGGDFGVLRFTTRFKDYFGEFAPAQGEATEETWRGGEVGLRVDRVSQSNTSFLEVSSISFGNVMLDDVAAPWAARDLQYGLRDRPVKVWLAVWPADDPTDAGLEGRFLIFEGRVGSTQHRERSDLALNPSPAPWNMKSGSGIYNGVCRFALAGLYGNTGEAAETCQVGATPLSTFPTCGGTLAECIERENEVHYGGHPLMLKPNTPIHVGGQRFTV